jgi:hypothetical protein
MMIARPCSSLSIMALLVGCADQDSLPHSSPVQETVAADHPAAPSPLLTAHEMATLLLDHAMVWKFQSSPAVSLHKVRVQVVDGGRPRMGIALDQPKGAAFTTIIVLILPDAAQTYHLKLYGAYAGVEDGIAMDVSFLKPLTTYTLQDPSQLLPITCGTRVLLSGTSDPISAQPVAITPGEAPCRIVLTMQ